MSLFRSLILLAMEGGGRGATGHWADLCIEEETLLIGFFGMDYVRYRGRTRVGIPLIP